jgi:hypothetical protein
MAEDRSTSAGPVPVDRMINEGFGKSKPADGVQGKPIVDNDGTQGGSKSPEKLGY